MEPNCGAEQGCKLVCVALLGVGQNRFHSLKPFVFTNKFCSNSIVGLQLVFPLYGEEELSAIKMQLPKRQFHNWTVLIPTLMYT